MENSARDRLTNVTLVVPSHVVYREFVSETVLLNINTGQYHGLNPIAGVMLEAIDQTGSVQHAVSRLAEHFGQPADRIEQDLTDLCEGLIGRGLLEVRDPVDDS